MRNTHLFLLWVFILLVLSSFFITLEGFVNPNTDEDVIVQTKPGAVDRIEIRCTGRWIYHDHWLYLRELDIYDKNSKKINYGNANNVYFAKPNGERGGQTGYQNNGLNPIRNLWDDDINTFAHVSDHGDYLVIKLNPPQEIGRIELTTAEWELDRLRNHTLFFYKENQVIARMALRNMFRGRSTTVFHVVQLSGQGDQGDKGDPGERGIQGERGEKGDKGGDGLKGEKGDKGDQGEKGPKGNQGEKGEKGGQGPMGKTGVKGDPGDRGDRGEKGDIGPQGIQGRMGNQGQKGIKGLNGNVGETGPEGRYGIE